MVADPAYRARRERSVAIGVNCSTPGETCFCVSMNTGPRCTTGYDIALTELDDGFTAEAGTDAGADLIDALTTVEADDAQVAASNAVSERAAERMGRKLETADLPGLLYRNREHPRWDEVASRCLTCTNCTMVCPTCFCHDLTDQISLDGTEATRDREWASCFSEEFSHMSFGEVRSSAQVPVPPVAHAQVLVVDRPVRHERMRRLRPVHHVVSGRHRRHRGDRRDPHDRRRDPRRRGRCSR